MPDTPLEQLVVAVAMYCTVGLTVLLLAGAVTVTPATADVAKVASINRGSSLYFMRKFSSSFFFDEAVRAQIDLPCPLELHEPEFRLLFRFRQVTRSKQHKPKIRERKWLKSSHPSTYPQGKLNLVSKL